MSHSTTKARRFNGLKTLSPSFVYFIQDTQNKEIKIGVSRDVDARLRGLQTARSHPLIVLKTIPGGRDVETSIHEKFAHARLGGEWFIPTDDLLEFITGMPWHGMGVTHQLQQTSSTPEAKAQTSELQEPWWVREIRFNSGVMLFILSWFFIVATAHVVSAIIFPEQTWFQQVATASGGLCAWVLFIRWYFL